MFKKGTKLYPILKMKCPKCHNGDLFPTGSFEFKKPFDMNDRCTVCNENFMPEPGFYFGAMFISYIFTGWFCITFVGILHWGLGMGVNASFGLLLFILAVFFVWIFRMARSVWIGFQVAYRGH